MPSTGAVTVVAIALAAQTLASRYEPQSPAYRGRVAIVPVDVRVIDRAGNPVRDLTRDEFSILENGVEQTISHFEIVDRAVGERSSDVDAVAKPIEAGGAAPRNFIIVLGRGRVQGPSKGLDGVLTFIDRQTLPNDRLAVAAYDRITELTTDRLPVRRLIERYRDQHERIEAILAHWYKGLTASFGDADPPPSAQALINRLFDAPGLPPFRSLGVLIQGEVLAQVGDRPRGGDIGNEDEFPRRGFIYNAAARQDLEKLHGAVEYLRRMDGEKHIALISAEGLLGVVPSHIDRLVRLAADARVVLSVIHTGGVPTSWVRSGKLMVFQGPTWAHLWANANSRRIADATGGVASTYEYANRTLDRLERATRLQYLLAYYPPEPTTDRAFRRITVRVRRPGVTVLHRHGYYARNDERVHDRRESIANARIASAGALRSVVTDVPLELSTSVRDGSTRAEWHVTAHIRIPPRSIAFTESNGRHVALLDVAIFVGGADKKMIGELRKRVDLRLMPENYDRMVRDGFMFTGPIKVTERPRHLKAIVYDFGADRVGSAVTELRTDADRK